MALFLIINYEACRDKPDKLIKLIEEIGVCMCKELFNVFVYNRCNSSASAIREIKKEYNNEIGRAHV